MKSWAIAVAVTIAAWAPCNGAFCAVEAVFVGVDRYANSHQHRAGADPKFHDLEDSVVDVRLMKKALHGAGHLGLDPGADPRLAGCAWSNETSTTLIDACATRAAVLKALSDRIARANSGDLLFFFFSGLGSHTLPPAGESEATFLMSDARPVTGNAPELTLAELRVLEDRAAAKQVRMFSVLEACSATESRGNPPEYRFAPPGLVADTHSAATAKRLEPARRIMLACGGQPTDVGYGGMLNGVLASELANRSSFGRLPWEISAPVSDPNFPWPMLPGEFNLDASGQNLVYIPRMPPSAVVNGIRAKPGEAVWMAELRHPGPMKPGFADTAALRHACGGALIAPNWVTTAAHCLEQGDGTLDPSAVPQRLVVRMGSNDLDGPMRVFHIIRAVVHPAFCDPDWTDDQAGGRPSCAIALNDIALLLLGDEPESVAELNIVQVAVAPLQSDLPDGAGVEVLGWGATSARNGELGRVEAHLQKAALRVIGAGTCRRENARAARAEDSNDTEFDHAFPDTVFCAGVRGSRTDSCRGDSGGPVVLLDPTRPPTLVGIVSTGVSCAKAPGIYTKVAQFRPWMNAVMTDGLGEAP